MPHSSQSPCCGVFGIVWQSLNMNQKCLYLEVCYLKRFDMLSTCFKTSHRIIVIHFISAYIPCQCFKQKSHRIILHQPCHVNPGNNPASKTRTYSSFVATTALRTSRSKSSRCTSSKPLLRAISKPIPVTGETVMNIWNLIGDGKLMNVQHYMDSNYINK